MAHIRSLERLAVLLNLDQLANGLMERLYGSSGKRAGRLARRFQILTYHKVSRDAHPFFEPVRPAAFDTQMKLLKQYYRVMPLKQLVEMSREDHLPDRAIAITFDDGYLDNYEYAFPILKKYDLPATIFVATGAIETNTLLWHDRLFDAFRYASVKRAFLNDEVVRELTLNPISELKRSLRSALTRVRALYGESQRKFVGEIEAKLKPNFPHDHYRPRMLSWSQIREMHSAGIEFGSHTVNHPILSRLPRETMVRELQESKEQLSQQLNATIDAFAYPNGKAADFTPEVKSALKEAGYSYAVTTEGGVNVASTDPFELRRRQPWPERSDAFRLSLCLERHGLIV